MKLRLWRRLLGALGVLAVFGASSPSFAASLIGDEVTCSSSFGCTPVSAVVLDGGGPEFTRINASGFVYSADVFAGNVVFTNISNNTIRPLTNTRITLSDFDWSGPFPTILSAVTLPDTPPSGLTLADFTVFDDGFTVNLVGVQLANRQSFEIGLVTFSEPASVPLPPPAVLLVLCLSGLAVLVRRRREG